MPNKKEETPKRRARRNYELRNKEERQQATKQFNTRLSREGYEEIAAFLKVSKCFVAFLRSSL